MLMHRAHLICDEEVLIAETTGTPARDVNIGGTPEQIAALASDLHRLAPACKRHAEAECNGEWRDGQRDAICAAFKDRQGERLEELIADIVAYGNRLDKRIAKLNEKLAPLAVQAVRTGDPRGWTLRLHSTDKSRPVPRNGWADESFGIG